MRHFLVGKQAVQNKQIFECKLSFNVSRKTSISLHFITGQPLFMCRLTLLALVKKVAHGLHLYMLSLQLLKSSFLLKNLNVNNFDVGASLFSMIFPQYEAVI